MSNDHDRSSRDDTDISYQAYFDATPGIISVQDRDLRIVRCNDRLRELFGDPTGALCYEFFKGRKEVCPGCPVVESFRTGKRQRSESVVTTKNGEELPVMVFTSPIKNRSGEIVHVLELAANISDVKQLQKKVFQAQQRLKQFFDQVPCYVSVQSRELKLVAANRRFKDDFGDDVGDFCYKVYKHRGERCLECPVEKTFEDGQSHQSEEIVTSMSGDQYNVLVHTAPIRDENGEITHVLEMSTNITPIRKLQSQLESTGLLISSISHSIKGLLTGLDGGMYLVNSGLSSDNTKRLKQGWEMVTRNVDRIRSTVLNILYYAKEREPKYERLSAEHLVEEVYSVMKPKAEEHGIALIMDIAPDSGEFEGDHQAIRSLFVNLMENSIDACRVDKKKAEHGVKISVKSVGEKMVFEVEDNGIGVDRETREKMFTLFFSSKGMEGTGLGLFIANNIAKTHGGGIEVESEVDKGTRFSVTIKRKLAPGLKEASGEEAFEPPAAGDGL